MVIFKKRSSNNSYLFVSINLKRIVPSGDAMVLITLVSSTFSSAEIRRVLGINETDRAQKSKVERPKNSESDQSRLLRGKSNEGIDLKKEEVFV